MAKTYEQPTFTNLEEQKFDVKSPMHVIMYGPAGCGKTTLLGTCPKPMLIFDFDGKLKPIMGIAGIHVLSYRITDPAKTSGVFNRFRTDFRAFINKKMKAPNGEDFASGAMDSATAFDLLVLHHCINLAGKNMDEGEYATLPTYQDQASYYKSWMMQISSIRDVWFFLTAHEAMRETETDGVFKIMPLLTGPKTLDRLPGVFDEVWKMDRNKNGTPMLKIHGTGRHVSNSMLFRGKTAIENPTFEKIMIEAGKVKR